MLAAAALLAQLPRPGVAPDTPWNCPPGHAIKGYMTTAARRIYYVPGDPFYDEASPERCYANEDEARRDGARPATGGGAPPPGTVQGGRSVVGDSLVAEVAFKRFLNERATNHEEMGMPNVTIQWYAGRTEQQKRELTAAITEAIVRIGKTTPDQVHIVFQDIEKSNWGWNGKLAIDR